MNTVAQKIIKTNHYVFRSSGFIATFLMQIFILLFTAYANTITENQFKVFDSLITSCFLYQITYISNNFADYAVKTYLEKKGLNGKYSGNNDLKPKKDNDDNDLY